MILCVSLTGSCFQILCAFQSSGKSRISSFNEVAGTFIMDHVFTRLNDKWFNLCLVMTQIYINCHFPNNVRYLLLFIRVLIVGYSFPRIFVGKKYNLLVFLIPFKSLSFHCSHASYLVACSPAINSMT